MATDSFKVKNSLHIAPKAGSGTEAGDLRVDASDSNKLKFHNGSSEDSVVFQTQADALDSDISNLESDVSTLQSEMDTAQSDIDTLQSDLDTAENDIATLQSDLGTAENDINQIESDISTIQTDITNIPSDFADDTSLDLATSNTSSTVNVGTGTGANTINIGGANTTINMTGTVNNQNVTNLDVDDKLITINKGGAAGSGAVAGLEVEENSTATGRVATSADRNSWEFKAPNTAGVASLTPGSSNDEIALLAKAQTLSSKTLTTPITDVITLDGQASTPANPSSGFYKMYAKDDGKFYKLDSTGLEKQLGSGGGAGGKNYLQDLFDGTSVTGINTYKDAAAATPVDGTGGSPSVISAAALNSSTPLRGTSSQRLSKGSGSAQGEGWSTDFVAERADYEGSNRVIVKFRYKTSSNYVNGDVRVFAVNKDTGAVLNVLSLSGDGSLLPASNTTGFVGSFNFESASDDYRIVLHITSTTSAAWDLDLIDLSVGPDQVVPGAIRTPTEPATVTGSWVSNTTYTAFKSRDGDWLNLEVRVATSGAPTAASLEINLPSGLVMDTSKMVSTGAGTYSIFSRGLIVDSGSRKQFATAIFSTTTSFFVTGEDGTSGGSVSNTIPMTWGSGDYLNITIRVPIVGWAASASLPTTETMYMKNGFLAEIASFSMPYNSITTVTGYTEAYDNLSAFNPTTGIWTCPKTGYYFITGQIQYDGGTGGTRQMIVTKNGTSTVVVKANDGGQNVSEQMVTSTKRLYLVTGDTLRMQGFQNQTSTSALTTSNNIAATFFSVVEDPALSSFSVYGNFELLTATSSTKTPSGSGHFHALTGNSINLPIGTWKIKPSAKFASSGSPVYTFGSVGIFAANGADTSSTPALLSTIGTVMTAQDTSYGNAAVARPLSATGVDIIEGGYVIFRNTSPVTVYAVSRSEQSTSANARITVYANAERLQ